MNDRLHERPDDPSELGQFIPLHYHYQMLADDARMAGFRAAIAAIVRPGSAGIDLGSGTGVLSFFAAEKARKVYAVEKNPELAAASRRILRLNAGGERIEVIEADAREYMPPEPVDFVLCEMLHVGLLREKQLDVLDAFKRNYQERFGGALPVFVPGATIQALQPVCHDFRREGFFAPVPQFQAPYSEHPETVELGAPAVYHQVLYEEPYDLSIRWSGDVSLASGGNLNALRVITKNLLAIEPTTGTTVDWFNQYLILPIEREIPVIAGQSLRVSLSYEAGAPLWALHPDLRVGG